MLKHTKGKPCRAFAVAALIFAAPAPAAVQDAVGSEEAAADIVVTAQRIGIPVWKVEGPQSDIVLIGAIDMVAPGTRWNPGALTETLRRADRVLFTNVVTASISPLAAIGYLMRWRKQATLPKGRTLAHILKRSDLQRLAALRERGLIEAGFERKHPVHLAMQLRSRTQGKMKETAGANGYVRHAVKTYKLDMVKIRKVQGKGVAKAFFAAPPEAFVPCLLDAIALAEAGPGAFKARSDDWAERRIQAVLRSPADRDFLDCGPESVRRTLRPDVAPQIRQLLSEPKATVAVVDLRTLAEQGGVLDDLKAAGFQVQGPDWKR